MKLLVGADPELFVMQGAAFVSAHGLIDGTKQKPHPVKNGAVQVDGMALEFNIDPADNATQFIYNIKEVMSQLQRMVPANLDIVISATADFDEEYMKAQPEAAKELGCDPDFNAYTMEPNPRPDQHPSMRTAAGHVHLGWTSGENPHDANHFITAAHVAKQMDYFLGLPSIILDGDTKRKEMYGKAGAFRPKPYGCEYRVMSNFWLQDQKLMELVFNNAQAGFHMMAKEGRLLHQELGQRAQEIINNNQREEAIALCSGLGINFEV